MPEWIDISLGPLVVAIIAWLSYRHWKERHMKQDLLGEIKEVRSDLNERLDKMESKMDRSLEKLDNRLWDIGIKPKEPKNKRGKT